MIEYIKAGAKEGLTKVVKIIPYLVGSMILAGLTLYVSNQSVGWQQAKLAMLLAGANVIIAFLREWLPATK